MNTRELIRQPKIFKVKSLEDPFEGTTKPNEGCTGLVVAECGFDIGKHKLGEGEVSWFVFRSVRQSMDYWDAFHEELMCGVSNIFYCTYWKVNSEAEARWMIANTIRKILK